MLRTEITGMVGSTYFDIMHTCECNTSAESCRMARSNKWTLLDDENSKQRP